MAASDVSDEETDSHIFMILSFLFFSCVASDGMSASALSKQTNKPHAHVPFTKQRTT